MQMQLNLNVVLRLFLADRLGLVTLVSGSGPTKNLYMSSALGPITISSDHLYVLSCKITGPFEFHFITPVWHN
jgi:hypothetical protein